MRRLIPYLSGLTLLCATTIASAEALERAIEQCRSLVESELRLKCYDQLDLRKLQAIKPRFSGKRSVKTELFTITEPTLIRYQSDGVIFVLAIHDKSGEVVQNLHIGGSGESTYLLDKPGEYFLRINGSTTWKIWLEKP